jgi:hypothetical protein
MTFRINSHYNYWDTLRAKLQKCNFWNLPFDEPRCGQGVLDGGTYMIEGRENGKYKIIVRANPINEVCPYRREIMDLIQEIRYMTEPMKGFQL